MVVHQGRWVGSTRSISLGVAVRLFAATVGALAVMRGHVSECLRGEQGWATIDRISHKYIGGPYPLREDRVAFLVQVEHAFAQTFE